ncbi:hypothetical protein [Sphingorhabdus sp. SMR4y]|uniref:hypothetical protein n=1 Tax=Sphingorhabdus sp. SMR4y TaxID=2584094 RepID=UPI000B5CB3FF|nr:hypothetical protein [Sphingorhabdus sp. SMR4y]ASK89450.1 hypothetical protein SPHFLASMR4Y_02712 [Sphingorhabdus sp. SMR4y]
MNKVKTRNLLVLVHLFLAAFLAPSFLLVGLTGALKLAGVEASIEDIPIELPAETRIDPDSPTLKQDIAAVLATQNIHLDIESVRSRAGKMTTRPTSRTFARINQTPDGLEASLHKPGFQYAMMELHKGHGPALFKTYQLIAGIALFLVIVGGLVVGLMARPYRRKALASLALGSIAFLALGFAV